MESDSKDKSLTKTNPTETAPVDLALGSLRDWPHWMGPGRDGVWREKASLQTLPKHPQVRWRTKLHTGYSGPSVVGDRVFVTDFVRQTGRVTNRASTLDSVAGKERVLCLDADTGKVRWQHSYEVAYSASYPEGPRTTPLVHANKVYTVGTDGHLLCLATDSGKVQWSKRFADYGAKTPFWGHSAHPVRVGESLVCMVGGTNATVVAFDLSSGKELWRALDAKEPGYAPPALARFGGKTTLLVWHPESLNALDPKNGNVLWSLPMKARSGMSVTAPLVIGHDVYISGIGTPPTLVRVAKDGNSAEVVWRGRRKGIIAGNSSHLAHAGILYGVDTQGRLAASRLATGNRLWSTFEATTGSRGEKFFTAFLVRRGDHHLLFNEKGELLLAKLSAKGYTELGRCKILEPTTSTYGRQVV